MSAKSSSGVQSLLLFLSPWFTAPENGTLVLVEQVRVAVDSPCVVAHCVALAKYGSLLALAVTAELSDLSNRPDPCPSSYSRV